MFICAFYNPWSFILNIDIQSQSTIDTKHKKRKCLLWLAVALLCTFPATCTVNTLSSPRWHAQSPWWLVVVVGGGGWWLVLVVMWQVVVGVLCLCLCLCFVFWCWCLCLVFCGLWLVAWCACAVWCSSVSVSVGVGVDVAVVDFEVECDCRIADSTFHSLLLCRHKTHITTGTCTSPPPSS
jgi:hypothetical protein